ncbi:MAG TPA: cyclic nucleotide-binding domain-containing protein, partial [bacterium]|nr:cyclic nucleotide-binding domain-containing protein [bacterium]
MLTVIEKVIFLQNVDVFLEVLSEQLAYLAAIAEEITYLKGDNIYKADDPSDAMYFVLEGKVKLHRDGEEVMIAESKVAFGTWALFDEEPRVVTATAIEDTKLLRIYADDFYDLLADNVQITQGIFKALVRRMRNLIE